MFVSYPVEPFLTSTEPSSTRASSRWVQRDARSGTRQALLLGNDLIGRGEVAKGLDSAGCSIIRAETARDALELIGIRAFDIVVIDIRPDLVGYEAICALRAARVTLPLLFISARSTPEALQRALSLGADDVGVLPLDAISSRVTALIERGPQVLRPGLRIGPLQLNLDSQQASVGPNKLTFTEAEFAVVELLATRNGAPVRLECIAHRLRDMLEKPGKRAVEELVARIRRKLAPFQGDILIAKVRGFGFALHTPCAVNDA
jgi:DNA-binding response OmpR family regulator